MTSTLQRNIDLALGTKSQPLRWKMSSGPRLTRAAHVAAVPGNSGGSGRDLRMGPSSDVKIAIENGHRNYEFSN